ncbi:hypothetical protein [Palaeococcus ferrophilus]|uniref:hypothetical protein n=1 Tax=Palaeococcus ferrophilus TaxID=83868 RepID=UPI00064EE71E|nr:hypothetical protein [Palaeococcus ferrophilus]
MIEYELLSAGATAVITALLTAVATSKANERVLKNIMERMEDMEERIYNHENRLSRLEGRIVGSVIK